MEEYVNDCLWEAVVLPLNYARRAGWNRWVLIPPVQPPANRQGQGPSCTRFRPRRARVIAPPNDVGDRRAQGREGLLAVAAPVPAAFHRPVAEPASLQFVRSAGATAACLIHVGGLATSTTTGIVEVARILEHEKTRQQRCRAPDRTGEFPELFKTCSSRRRGRRRTRCSCCRPSSTGSPGRRPGGRHRCCRDRG